MDEPTIVAVVAIGRNRELGRGNKLLWHIPDDLKRFKALTLGHPIIMGRKTFESVAEYVGGPLPGRTNIIVTRDKQYDASKYFRSVKSAAPQPVLLAHSLEEAIATAKKQPGASEIHIGGGAELYRVALPQIGKLWLTQIDAEAPDADAFFPPYEREFVKKVFDEEREWNGLRYRWVDLERT